MINLVRGYLIAAFPAQALMAANLPSESWLSNNYR
jgi:hypothetical protein